jgi:cell division protein FtsB
MISADSTLRRSTTNPLLEKSDLSIIRSAEQSQRADLLRAIMVNTKSRNSHAKEIYYILCIVLLVVITMFSVWGPGGYFEMKRARRELDTQRERIETLKRSNQNRIRAIEALRTNRETLERLARENGYGKEGEIVQQLPEEAGPKTTAKSAR